MNPNRTEILRLYKSLLRYGEVISLTDKSYFKRRIQKEFKENKTASEDITFLYEASFYFLRLLQCIVTLVY